MDTNTLNDAQTKWIKRGCDPHSQVPQMRIAHWDKGWLFCADGIRLHAFKIDNPGDFEPLLKPDGTPVDWALVRACLEDTLNTHVYRPGVKALWKTIREQMDYVWLIQKDATISLYDPQLKRLIRDAFVGSKEQRFCVKVVDSQRLVDAILNRDRFRLLIEGDMIGVGSASDKAPKWGAVVMAGKHTDPTRAKAFKSFVASGGDFGLLEIEA
ncbi:MAG: hypothetical protein SF123_09700 [Chloroflexota bacterium]|nr:hypothetical protein [Chloroflexota bacterium]